VNPAHWQPSASIELLELRAQTLAEIRRFFAARNVLEIETPALSNAGTSDVGLESMSILPTERYADARYLHTSPEYAMKRLIAAGSGDIFQVCRVFRAAELGRWHEPEFTMLEWYRVDWDDEQLMTEVEKLLLELLSSHLQPGAAVRISYRDAFRETVMVDPVENPREIRAALERNNIDVPEGISDDGLLDLALSQIIVPHFDPDTITFIYDFPVDQAALARIKSQNPPVAARFEAFSGGIELANGFAELTDATEQRQRFEADLAKRRRDGRHEPPLNELFLAALRAGMPSCAGVAVGVDRVIALAAGLNNVAATMSFAHRQAPT